MTFKPELAKEIAPRLEKWWGREAARKELADLMSEVVIDARFGTDAHSARMSFEDMTAHLPAEKRQKFVDEMTLVADRVGWRRIQSVLKGQINLKHELTQLVNKEEGVQIYHCATRKPEDVTECKDFIMPDDKRVMYWIPTKKDILGYVHTAVTAHEASGRSGPVKLLDIGGGSGFLSKLIADELSAQGIDSEVVVLDPDIEAVSRSADMYAETSNLRFETGTARDAVMRYGPKLSAEDQELFALLEKRTESIKEHGKLELGRIESVLAAFEGHSSLKGLLKSPLGNKVAEVLKQSGLSKDLGMTELKNELSRYFDKRYSELESELNALRSQQESLYANADAKSSSFDVVLNSWMPRDIDFTREIRMISAPAVIYARAGDGASGVSYILRTTTSLGSEESYETGDLYEEVTDWDGVATVAVDPRLDWLPNPIKRSFSTIQMRKDIGITEDSLSIDVASDEKYPWEASLDPYKKIVFEND